MRESKIENAYRGKIEGQKGVSYKFVSPGIRGVPDRISLWPVPLELRKLISCYIEFCELKAPGKRQNARQKRECKIIRDLGFRVRVIDEL